MHGLENEKYIYINFPLNDGKEVSDRWVMAEKTREADAHSPKRLAAGRTTSSNQ